MDTSKELTQQVQGIRDQIENLVRVVDSLSKRTDEIMTELARIKESQNEVLAGLALWERGRRLKESLEIGQERERGPREIPDVEHETPGEEESRWDEIQAYCRNCTRMTPISEPVATFQDERTTIRAKCRVCGTMVVRTLV